MQAATLAILVSVGGFTNQWHLSICVCVCVGSLSRLGPNLDDDSPER